jgi:hypothetical protein
VEHRGPGPRRPGHVSDRGCPVGSGIVRPMWHAAGTTEGKERPRSDGRRHHQARALVLVRLGRRGETIAPAHCGSSPRATRRQQMGPGAAGGRPRAEHPAQGEVRHPHRRGGQPRRHRHRHRHREPEPYRLGRVQPDVLGQRQGGHHGIGVLVLMGWVLSASGRYGSPSSWARERASIAQPVGPSHTRS